MATPLVRKLGLNPGMQAFIVAPPRGYLKLLTPRPKGPAASSRAVSKYPFVQIFVTRLRELHKIPGILSKHAAPNALVWISYPKKTAGSEGDLSRDVIREALRVKGWRAVSIIAIDPVWSALRFRPTSAPHSRATA